MFSLPLHIWGWLEVYGLGFIWQVRISFIRVQFLPEIFLWGVFTTLAPLTTAKHVDLHVISDTSHPFPRQYMSEFDQGLILWSGASVSLKIQRNRVYLGVTWGNWTGIYLISQNAFLKRTILTLTFLGCAFTTIAPLPTAKHVDLHITAWDLHGKCDFDCQTSRFWQTQMPDDIDTHRCPMILSR